MRKVLWRTWFSCLILPFFFLPAKGADLPAGESQQIGFPGGKTYLYRLSLTDKNGTPYSLSRPSEFLSAKSLNRRKNQSLSVDSTDLPINPHYVERIAAVDGVEVACMSKWNNTVLVKVKSTSKIRPLTAFPFVAKAERVFSSPDSIEPPSRFIFHKELDRTEGAADELYGVAAQNIDIVNGRGLHRMGFRGRGMTIAVFDGGFMNVDRIPVMKEIRIVGTKDFVAFKSDNIYQEHDHGTKVLSTIGVDEPGIFVGTAPEAEFWLIRTEDTRTESLAEEDYWAAAAEFADSVGVDIISSSLGFQDFDDKSTDHLYSELDGRQALISRTASMLASKGIVHVNSAGNEGMGTWKKINFPADASDILAVGAVNAKRVNATFSSLGPTQDGRVKPDIMSLGSPASVITGRGTVSSDMGTSFAAPIISGMVACLWQSAPGKTALQVMDAIRRSADNYDTPNNVFGYGIPDFNKAYSILKEK